MEYNADEALKLENQLCFPLYAAARKVVGAYTPYLKPLDLTYTQYILFLVLWEKDHVTVSEICDRLMLDSGTVTPLLKKLESKDYLRRERCENDERCVNVVLTDDGKAMKDKVKDIPLKVSRCNSISPEKAMQLYSLLYELIGGDGSNE